MVVSLSHTVLNATEYLKVMPLLHEKCYPSPARKDTPASVLTVPAANDYYYVQIFKRGSRLFDKEVGKKEAPFPRLVSLATQLFANREKIRDHAKQFK
jgi:hypothetical protein